MTHLSADHLMILRAMRDGSRLRWMPRGVAGINVQSYLEEFGMEYDSAMRDLWLGARRFEIDEAMMNVIDELIDLGMLLMGDEDDETGIWPYHITPRGRYFAGEHIKQIQRERAA